jgi:hypothetical protein
LWGAERPYCDRMSRPPPPLGSYGVITTYATPARLSGPRQVPRLRRRHASRRAAWPYQGQGYLPAPRSPARSTVTGRRRVPRPRLASVRGGRSSVRDLCDQGRSPGTRILRAYPGKKTARPPRHGRWSPPRRARPGPVLQTVVVTIASGAVGCPAGVTVPWAVGVACRLSGRSSTTRSTTTLRTVVRSWRVGCSEHPDPRREGGRAGVDPDIVERAAGPPTYDPQDGGSGAGREHWAARVPGAGVAGRH